MKRSFPTDAPVELYVELGAGTICTDATATAEATVEVTGPRADDFSVELSGRRLSVVAPRSRRQIRVRWKFA